MFDKFLARLSGERGDLFLSRRGRRVVRVLGGRRSGRGWSRGRGSLHGGSGSSLLRLLLLLVVSEEIVRKLDAPVTPPVYALTQELAPVLVLGHEKGVADDDQQRLGSGDGDVEALRIRHEPEVIPSFFSRVLGTASREADDDDAFFPTLELFRRPDPHGFHSESAEQRAKLEIRAIASSVAR